MSLSFNFLTLRFFITALLCFKLGICTGQIHGIDNLETIEALKTKTLIIPVFPEEVGELDIDKIISRKFTFCPYVKSTFKEAEKLGHKENYLILSNLQLEEPDMAKEGQSILYRQVGLLSEYVNPKSLKWLARDNTPLYLLSDFDLYYVTPFAEKMRQLAMCNYVFTFLEKCTDRSCLGYSSITRKWPFEDITGLKDKTLLIRIKDISSSFEKITMAYGGRIKYATNEEIAQAILDSDDSKAILTYHRSMLYGYHTYFMIQNAATGQIYYFNEEENNKKRRRMNESDFKKILQD